MAGGVRGCGLRDEPRELVVAPGRTLKLTTDVLSHFRVNSESDYPADRTAVIVSEAHASVDAQMASFHGLEAMLKANTAAKKDTRKSA